MDTTGARNLSPATAAWYRTLFEEAPHAILIVDSSGNYVDANRYACEMLGYPRDMLLGLGWSRLLAPDDLVHGALQRGEAGRDDAAFVTCRLCTQDGRWLPVEINSRPIADGRRIAFLRPSAEVALATAAARDHATWLAGVVASAMDAIITVDADQRIVLFNAAAEQMFRCPAAEALGQSMERFIPSRYRAVHRGHFHTFEATGATNRSMGALADLSGLRADGEEFPIEASISQVDAGGRRLFTVIVRDITARRQAEEALRLALHEKDQALAQIDALFASAPIGLGFWNRDLYFHRLNRALAEINGLPIDGLPGKHMREIMPGGSGIEELVTAWEKVLATGEALLNIEYAGKSPSWPGETRYWSSSVFPVHLGNEIIGLGAAVLDITERKQAEAAQAELEAQLYQTQRLESVGRLAGGIAHDFNNLLMVIHVYSDLMRAELPPDSPLIGKLDQIRRASERAAALTRQLLAFSRKQILAPTILDLNHLVTNLLKMLERLIGEDVALSMVLQPGIWSVTADPSQIEQVIMNLVVNARDAMPTGGQLTIETHNVHFDASYARMRVEAPTGPCVMLAISDTGHGMDEATRSRIFEPFFTTKQPGQGTGLGLATVHGIVKQSGGDILVYSEPGQGTIFKVILPATGVVAEGSSAPTAKGLAGGGPETILLVEDEDMVRGLVREVLVDLGYTVLVAPGGNEALALASQHEGPIALLLTDVVMPRVGGPELAERLRSVRPQTKVLFMSGYTDDAVIRHGLLTAEAAFLAKPFSPNALADKIRALLDGQQPGG
jgi:two-component system, cell cycle sensor histidine kinase and response regulator CckA